MRRAACVLAVLLACAACTRSGGEADAALHADLPAEGVGYTAEFSERAETEPSGGYAAIDLDLTGLNPTMLYAEVSHMNSAPAEYDGKVVRFRGTFAAIPARDGVQLVCRAVDAAGCCYEPIEFLPRDAEAWADESDYPAEGEEITVTGRFEAYAINEYMTYARICGAEIER